MKQFPSIQWPSMPFFDEKKWDGQYRVIERTHNSGASYYVSQSKRIGVSGFELWQDVSDQRHDDKKTAIAQCQRLFNGRIKSERTVAK